MSDVYTTPHLIKIRLRATMSSHTHIREYANNILSCGDLLSGYIIFIQHRRACLSHRNTAHTIFNDIRFHSTVGWYKFLTFCFGVDITF